LHCNIYCCDAADKYISEVESTFKTRKMHDQSCLPAWIW
jgi:hypothetical protein